MRSKLTFSVLFFLAARRFTTHHLSVFGGSLHGCHARVQALPQQSHAPPLTPRRRMPGGPLVHTPNSPTLPAAHSPLPTSVRDGNQSFIPIPIPAHSLVRHGFRVNVHHSIPPLVVYRGIWRYHFLLHLSHYKRMWICEVGPYQSTKICNSGDEKCFDSGCHITTLSVLLRP